MQMYVSLSRLLEFTEQWNGHLCVSLANIEFSEVWGTSCLPAELINLPHKYAVVMQEVTQTFDE